VSLLAGHQEWGDIPLCAAKLSLSPVFSNFDTEDEYAQFPGKDTTEALPGKVINIAEHEVGFVRVVHRSFGIPQVFRKWDVYTLLLRSAHRHLSKPIGRGKFWIDLNHRCDADTQLRHGILLVSRATPRVCDEEYRLARNPGLG
jgi:hypothetical protein